MIQHDHQLLLLAPALLSLGGWLASVPLVLVAVACVAAMDTSPHPEAAMAGAVISAIAAMASSLPMLVGWVLLPPVGLVDAVVSKDLPAQARAGWAASAITSVIVGTGPPMLALVYWFSVVRHRASRGRRTP